MQMEGPEHRATYKWFVVTRPFDTIADALAYADKHHPHSIRQIQVW
jgi:hypothetical protein